jgi:hypothetical protein
MHVLQHIAIQEEDIETAFESVKEQLESLMGNEDVMASWYDWFVTGGGRWANDPNAQYDDEYKGGVISYADTPDLFHETITQSIANRIAEFAEYRKSMENTDINAELDKYTGLTDYSFSLYPLKKMIDMLQGEWDFNSYFFDLTNTSTNPKHMLDKIAKGETNWFLVPVDFHF